MHFNMTLFFQFGKMFAICLFEFVDNEANTK
jgi:hypothetical protein